MGLNESSIMKTDTNKTDSDEKTDLVHLYRWFTEAVPQKSMKVKREEFSFTTG
jgi:hypothetical protein